MLSQTLSQFTRDAAGAVRLLRRQPAFAGVVLLTLTLGIGAPTAIFSVVNAVLLQPLPYPNSDRLVRFRIESRRLKGATFDAMPASTAVQWGLDTSTLDGIAIFNDRALTLTTGGGPFRLSGIATTANLFELLAVPPRVGQAFRSSAADDRQVVLSHETWMRFFGGDPAIVGRTVTLDAQAYRVAAVMPERFRFPSSETAFWVPMTLDSGGTRGMLLPVVARLANGVALDAALAEGRLLLGDDDMTLQARSLRDEMVGGSRLLLWVLMGSVAFVFVIATANTALLLLLRGTARRREFSVRLAVGGTHGRIVRQLLVEGLTFAGIGGVFGVALAAALVRVLVAVAPNGTPRLEDASLDTTALLFALALTLATSAGFGVLAAGKSLAFDVWRGLRTETPSLLSSPRARVRGLAVAEIALTVVLLVGAGLLIRSFVALASVHPGFDVSDTLAMQVSMPAAKYPDESARFAMHEQLLERVREIPGTDATGVAITMPNRQPSARFDFNPDGPRLSHDPLTMQVAEVRSVSEGFIEAIGIPVIAGRTFRAGDREGSEPVMVISQSLARLHFGDRDPIGRLLYSGSGDRRVIGVVGDVRPAAPRPQLSSSAYLPLRQSADMFRWFSGLTLVVRSPAARTLAPSLRSLVLSLDRDMPPFNVRTLGEETARLVAGPRFSASALTAFAVVALVLATIGVYGVMAYTASQRTHEIGVRVALGATRRQVVWLVIRDGVGLVAAGLVLGVTAAAWLTQTLTGMLHEVRPADPAAMVAVSLLLAATGLVAAWLPARRAARVDAVQALRAE